LSVYPVIMCGGSGTRLWPASRTDRPKQFIPLIGARSSFQETAARVAAIGDNAQLIVVAGVGHRAFIEAQLAEINLAATLILEPEARDSCAAMAAAAAWIAARDEDGVAVFVSADHHIPDAAAFRSACAVAIEEAWRGRIVTLGVRPTAPATAFGYIEAIDASAAVSPIRAFVEKPNAERAAAYVAAGYLWNSGNFITSAKTLLGELDAHAPDVVTAARAAVDGGTKDGAALLLGPAFRTAPKISIDFAVMEKTGRASVAPVVFAWSDIGAWDAVWAASQQDGAGNAGEAIFTDSANCLVQAPDGMTVAVIGANNLAVVADGDGLLVCDLGQSQAVKAIGERMKGVPQTSRAPFSTLAEARTWFDRWMTATALPLWWSLGADHEAGGFREVLDLSGVNPPRRGRVQPRQIYAFATAGAAGWPGPWRAATECGLAFLAKYHKRADGLYRTLVGANGAALDDTAKLYDQAFALLAFAALGREAEALQLFQALKSLRHGAGGWREAGDQPFQANAHMHLFEAMLAWSRVSENPAWKAAADEIGDLAMTRFIDPDEGFLREFYDADWKPASGDAGRMVEPGHQFEWAWLLNQWAAANGRADVQAAGRRLYAVGLRGIDANRGVAMNGLWDDFSVRSATARLWVQAEYLKAALVFGSEAEALAAAKAVVRYLDVPVPGAWRDVMTETGAFPDEPSPASTLYHLVSAWRQLCES